jgi:hypothetical protein
MKLTHALKIVGAVVAGAVTATTLVTAVGGAAVAAAWAGGTPDAQGPITAATADEMPPIIETFEYPNAEQIFQRTGVRLVRGDGHVVIADCQTPPVNNLGVIKVRTTEIATIDNGVVCFKVLNSTGFLQLEVPAVYEIRGDGQKSGTGHNITAIVKTEDGVLPPILVKPSESTEVGIGKSADNKPTTLLELRIRP